MELWSIIGLGIFNLILIIALYLTLNIKIKDMQEKTFVKFECNVLSQYGKVEERIKIIEENLVKMLEVINAYDREINISLNNLYLRFQSESDKKVKKIDSINEFIKEVNGLNEKEFSVLKKNLYSLDNSIKFLKELYIDRETHVFENGGEVIVKNESIIKHYGMCKLKKIVDIINKQEVDITYEDGLKVRSDTFIDNRIKYQLYFDKSGQPIRGVDLSDDGVPQEEYFYDESGEVSKRIVHKSINNLL